METGILYVVFNKWINNPETHEMPYKIGITRDSVDERYYGLGLKMPGKFETLFAYELEDYTKAEKLIQGILTNYRENGEWFSLAQRELDVIKTNCEILGGRLVTDEIEKEIEEETEETVNEDIGGREFASSKKDKLDKLDKVKKYFEDNNIPMGINETICYAWAQHARGGISFIIGFGKGNNRGKIHCDWEGGNRFNFKWLEGKKEDLEKEYPELEILIERGARNKNKVRMIIKVDQNNWLKDLLTIFNNTRKTMEFE
jgi:hypothetical protein